MCSKLAMIVFMQPVAMKFYYVCYSLTKFVNELSVSPDSSYLPSKTLPPFVSP